MLVLNRTPPQKVVIVTPDGPVVVTLIDINRGRVRLGFEASTAIKIMREEVLHGFTEIKHATDQNSEGGGPVR